MQLFERAIIILYNHGDVIVFEEFASVVNLGDYIYKDFLSYFEELEYKKRICSFHKHIRAMSKQEECFLCHKQCTSF